MSEVTLSALQESMQSRGLRVVRIKSQHVRNGLVYVRCIDIESGERWDDVPVITGSGTSVSRVHLVPKTKHIEDTKDEDEDSQTAQQLGVVGFREDGMQPVLLGTVAALEGKISQESPDSKSGEDISGKVGVNDHAIVNGGSAIFVREDGTIEIATRDDRVFKIQLGNSHFEIGAISEDSSPIPGDANDRKFGNEVALLGWKTLQYLQDLEATVENHKKRIADLEEKLAEVVTRISEPSTQAADAASVFEGGPFKAADDVAIKNSIQGFAPDAGGRILARKVRLPNRRGTPDNQ